MKTAWQSLSLIFLLLTASRPLLRADNPPVVITAGSLSDGMVGQDYLTPDEETVQLNATGGSNTGTYEWTYSNFSVTVATDGTYNGLSFNADGTISGIPLTSGALTFSAQAQDPYTNQLSSMVQFSIPIAGCTSVTLSPSSPLPPGEVGVPYTQFQFSASGCTGPYTYSVAGLNFGQNSYPSGLSVTGAGLFGGTPTVAGTFNIVVTATDPTQNQTPTQYTITINPPPSISTSSPLPNGIVNVAYSQQITAVGGTPPYTFSMNAEPPGIVNIDPNAGVLYGTPSKAGTYSFNIGVTDSLGVQTVSPFQVTFVTVASQIQATPLALTFNAGLNGISPPPQAITLAPANGATPPVTFTVVADAGQSGTAAPSWIAVTPTSGTAPAGLIVSVTPGTMAVGTYTARIQILDPLGVPTNVPVTLNVTSATEQLSIAPPVLNFAALSSAPGNFSQNLLVSNSGGVSLPFNTSVVGGNALIASVTTSSSPTNPNSPTLLQVQVNTDGLQVGAYHNTILVSSSSGTTEIPVSLSVLF